jgi:hypothetical protein
MLTIMQGSKQSSSKLPGPCTLPDIANLNCNAGQSATNEMDLLLPAWPMHITISNCNVDITDAPPEGSEMEGMDAHSPNPFLPSLMMIMDAPPVVVSGLSGA